MQSVTSNSPLPPSVEAAYYRKCIELKRRINEIEDSNDVIRTRKARVERSIMKLRLERAFLLEQITKRMENNVDDSDQSDSPVPTVCIPQVPVPRALRTVANKSQPQEKPLRSKRGHRKTTPPATSAPSSQQPTPAHSSTQPPAGQFAPASTSTAPPLTSPEHPSNVTPSLLQPLPQLSFSATQPPNLNGTQPTHHLPPLSGQGNVTPPSSSSPQPSLPPTQTTLAPFDSYDAPAPVAGSSEALANGPPGDAVAAHQSRGEAEVAAAASLTGLRERQNGDMVDTEMRDAPGFTAVNR